MKIAIDATRAVVENAGIGRYSVGIIKSLVKLNSGDDFLIFSTHFKDSAEKTAKLNALQHKNVKIKRWRLPGSVKEYLWSTRVNIGANFLEDSQVLFAPSFFEVQQGLKIPQVVVIHDMTASLFPDQRGEKISKRLALRTRAACHKARRIICVSKSTQDDLVKLGKINRAKSTVVYPGLTKFPPPAELSLGLKRNGYILSVGTLEPRKNLTGLFEAYALLPDDLKKKNPLVLVGGGGWNNDEIMSRLNQIDLKKQVILTGFRSDAQLARLYQDCAVFVYPSLYEGFGLPVIEAQSFGAPVITSNISSLPEAGGAGALYVAPQDIAQIAQKLEKLLKDDNLRRELGRKARDNAKRFSWEEAARQTLKVLKDSDEN